MTAPDYEALAAGEIDDVDEETLAHLARLYDTLDPLPSGLIDRVRFGITLDALHAEVAELQRSASMAGVRGDSGEGTSQTITFTSAQLTTMVTISAVGADRVRLDGWVVPGGGVEVELRRPDGSVTTTCDEDGRFVFAEVPRGLAQFLLRAPSGPVVVTPSVDL